MNWIKPLIYNIIKEMKNKVFSNNDNLFIITKQYLYSVHLHKKIIASVINTS